MICFHKIKFIGAFWQEHKAPGYAHGYKAYHLYKCEKCGKEAIKEVIAEGCDYAYRSKIQALENNGYKHINKYRTK